MTEFARFQDTVMKDLEVYELEEDHWQEQFYLVGFNLLNDDLIFDLFDRVVRLVKKQPMWLLNLVDHGGSYLP